MVKRGHIKSPCDLDEGDEENEPTVKEKLVNLGDRAFKHCGNVFRSEGGKRRKPRRKTRPADRLNPEDLQRIILSSMKQIKEELKEEIKRNV